MATELTIKMQAFEGPLDLLLHLIKELKIDVYDIPMTELTTQYLAYIHSMRELQLDVASEYLVMAATLLEIKSRMLIPRPQEVDEEEVVEEYEDPRQNLVEQLLEYERFKASAKVLAEKSQERSLYFAKEVSDLSNLQEGARLKDGEFTSQDLWNALKKMMVKAQAKQPLQANIYHELYTVEELMDTIVHKLEVNQQRMPMSECFPDMNRHAIVTTFLAMLQLVRSQSITFEQSEVYDDIIIVKI